MPTATTTRAEFRITGMDCAHDAAEIETAARGVAGVDAAKVSLATQTLTATLSADHALHTLERAVTALGYRLEPLGDAAREAAPPPAYRRALQVVVALNLGYGVVEAVGGYLSASQALRADALDFLGDGSITLVALLALRWSRQARARTALAQGIFLAALGAGVIASAAYRIVVQRNPDADLMSLFGVVALVVNLASATVLLPHRTGDASARAVWLFSRNDALGNLAVVVAAGLVALTRTPWPDLVVAIGIATLFLQSAWVIVRDAREELHPSANGRGA